MKRKIIILWNLMPCSSVGSSFLEESVVYIFRIEDIPEDHKLNFYYHESRRCCLNGNPFFLYSLCLNALWQCRLATPQESEEFPKTGAMIAGCSRVGNQEFTTCEPVEPVTCKVFSYCQIKCDSSIGYLWNN